MKSKIKKDEYEKLNDEIKKEYVEKDGEYLLSVDGKDLGALINAKNHEKENRQKEEELRKEAEKNAKKFEDDLKKLTKEIEEGKNKGDVEALTKSWEEKYSKLETSSNDATEKLKAHLTEILVDKEALRIASEISDSPELILPHIQKRLAADFDGSTPLTKVLDSEGKASALTVKELGEEFKNNEKFAKVIIGTKGSGSGTSGNSNDVGDDGEGGDDSEGGVSMEDMFTGVINE